IGPPAPPAGELTVRPPRFAVAGSVRPGGSGHLHSAEAPAGSAPRSRVGTGAAAAPGRPAVSYTEPGARGWAAAERPRAELPVQGGRRRAAAEPVAGADRPRGTHRDRDHATDGAAGSSARGRSAAGGVDAVDALLTELVRLIPPPARPTQAGSDHALPADDREHGLRFPTGHQWARP